LLIKAVEFKMSSLSSKIASCEVGRGAAKELSDDYNKYEDTLVVLKKAKENFNSMFVMACEEVIR